MAINNAIALAKSPNKTGSLEARFPKLQEYALALFEPLRTEIADEFLKPEEAVLICLAGALFHQMGDVMHTDKLPMGTVVGAVCPTCVEHKKETQDFTCRTCGHPLNCEECDLCKSNG